MCVWWWGGGGASVSQCMSAAVQDVTIVLYMGIYIPVIYKI